VLAGKRAEEVKEAALGFKAERAERAVRAREDARLREEEERARVVEAARQNRGKVEEIQRREMEKKEALYH